MNIPPSFKVSLAALATVGAALAPAITHAQTQPTAMGGSEWKTALSIYAYLPTISGATTFPTVPGNPSPGVNVDASTIIDHLKMTFMGSLDIHNGKWGVFNDILYLNVGGNKSNVRDFSVDGVPANVIPVALWHTASTGPASRPCPAAHSCQTRSTAARESSRVPSMSKNAPMCAPGGADRKSVV